MKDRLTALLVAVISLAVGGVALLARSVFGSWVAAGLVLAFALGVAALAYWRLSRREKPAAGRPDDVELDMGRWRESPDAEDLDRMIGWLEAPDAEEAERYRQENGPDLDRAWAAFRARFEDRRP